MRAARQLFATLARGEGSYLVPRQPTGLTGVLTHPSPRPHLIYIYNETLRALAALPEHSAYRQSTEALTRHRLSVVEGTVPDGLKEWRDRMTASLNEHQGWVRRLADEMVSGRGYPPQRVDETDERSIEWDNDVGAARAEGPRSSDPDSPATDQGREFGRGMEVGELGKQNFVLEDEPPLTADQVSEIEHKLNSGLLEEVVIVAQRELELVSSMQEHAVWEELVEKPAENQWTYFERSRP